MEQNFKRVFRLLPVKQIADIIVRSNTPVCVQVKLWRFGDPEQEQPSSPELTLQPGQGKLELVHFHPTSSGLLVVATAKSPLIWDTSRQEAPLAALEQHSDQLQSLSWKQDGSLLASSSKDKMLRVFDPRAQLTPVQDAISTSSSGEAEWTSCFSGERRRIRRSVMRGCSP
ncbi:hypothetical protein AMECASPLE_016756 [Ameca splendens]|uniref:Coronin n=1 Tax=Ameca splendens TaxID=208324 RepID=A0ABV0Z079_9TELE